MAETLKIIKEIFPIYENKRLKERETLLSYY